MTHTDSNKNNLIELVPYNREWPKMAELEITALRQVLPKDQIVDIQHVGSTAIPEIQAKPIIDIQIAVHSLSAVKENFIDLLQTKEYVYWEDNPDPERLFFVKGMPPFGEKRTHHVHVVEYTSKHWNDKLLFRDYLISHPEVAHEYENLKIKLAQQHAQDREKYTDAKSVFIHKILDKCRGSSKKS